MLGRLAVVAVGQLQPGNRDDCIAYSASRVDRAATGRR